MDFGTILMKLRAFKGYSQEAVAEEIGVSNKTYGRYESGKNEMKISTLKSLAKFYDMTVDELINFDPKNPYESKQKKYAELLEQRDQKIAALEKEYKYLTNEVTTLKDLVETKGKYLKLLEETVRDRGGGKTEDSFKSRAG